MFSKYDFRRFDVILVVIVYALAIIGVVAVGSATRINSIDGTAAVRDKQIIGLVTGSFLMIFFALFDYKWLSKLAVPIFMTNIGLLGAVLAVGKVVNNAKRWIVIGGFQLQPSEFSKLFTVLILAAFFAKFQDHINNIWVIIGSVFLTVIPVGLIFMQPDLSTSMIMAMIFVFMIFTAGISYWYIGGVAAVAIPGAIWGFQYIQRPDQKILAPYQVDRIMSMIYPDQASADAVRQTNNSIQAIGSGQIFGKGLYLGKVNQYDYLPEPQTDFIFAIIGEEFGFFGCVVVLLLLFLLIIRIFWIAKDSDMLGKLIVAGMSAILMYQTFINVGVATGILPNTGMPLPFISAGISSLWNIMIGIGIILNISMQRRKPGNINTSPYDNQRGSTS